MYEEEEESLVVVEIVQNPNTSEETLRLLIDDDSTQVIMIILISMRKDLSESLLQYMVKKYIKSRTILISLARQQNIPIDSVKKIYRESEDEEVLLSLCMNPKTPPSILFELYKQGNPEFNEAILKNPNYNIEKYIEEFIE